MFVLAPTESVFMKHVSGDYHVSHLDIPILTAIVGIVVFALYYLVIYVIAKSKNKLKEVVVCRWDYISPNGKLF